MKIKFFFALTALILFGFVAQPQFAYSQPADETGVVATQSDATTVPLENPDEPILEDVRELDAFEEAPQVDPLRDAPNKTAQTQGDQSPMVGAPTDWQINFGEGASPMKRQMNDFHHGLLYMVFGISAFVLLLLLYVIIRFRKKRNPVPSKTTHNLKLEVIWTLVPILILLVIVIPSMRLLYFTDKVVDADMTIIATGYQWYWGYEYQDYDNMSFLSYMVPDDELKHGQKRLLETDNRVVLPIDTDIRILTTANDVIHSFAVPSLGLKMDAVPGRTNETWVRIDREGVYYGQCSEICGINHGFMPITIEAVSKEKFEEWLVTAKEKFAAVSAPVQYAYLGE